MLHPQLPKLCDSLKQICIEDLVKLIPAQPITITCLNIINYTN